MKLFGFKLRCRVRHGGSYQIRNGMKTNNPSFFYTGKTTDNSGIVGRRVDIGRVYFHAANYGR